MLCWILIVGGLLIMMGQHDRSEALFYCASAKLSPKMPKGPINNDALRRGDVLAVPAISFFKDDLR
jgi:hypothetical protein